MSYDKISLPPLGDPALWWRFRNRTVHSVSNRIPIELDEWANYEQRGDKVASLVFFRLADQYNLLFAWANILHEIFASNEYWVRIGSALGLPDLSQFKSTVMADALEVLIPPHSIIDIRYISECSIKIHFIYLPRQQPTISYSMCLNTIYHPFWIMYKKYIHHQSLSMMLGFYLYLRACPIVKRKSNPPIIRMVGILKK